MGESINQFLFQFLREEREREKGFFHAKLQMSDCLYILNTSVIMDKQTGFRPDLPSTIFSLFPYSRIQIKYIKKSKNYIYKRLKYDIAPKIYADFKFSIKV